MTPDFRREQSRMPKKPKHGECAPSSQALSAILAQKKANSAFTNSPHVLYATFQLSCCSCSEWSVTDSATATVTIGYLPTLLSFVHRILLETRQMLACVSRELPAPTRDCSRGGVMARWLGMCPVNVRRCLLPRSCTCIYGGLLVLIRFDSKQPILRLGLDNVLTILIPWKVEECIFPDATRRKHVLNKRSPTEFT